MIVVTITAPDDRQYLVRFQEKASLDGENGWVDAETHATSGTSQPYGIDKGVTRLIVEDLEGVPFNAAS